MKTKRTILCENSVGRATGGVGEHGFACLIETEAGNVLFDSPKDLILVLGCAHVLQTFDRERIFAVIGGTHLGLSQPAQFDETLKAIDRYGIQRLSVSHCTGQEKAAILHARLGERFFFGCVGAELNG